MNEFELIGRYLAPLSANFPGAFNLTDDAAVLSVPAGMELVITNDAISEGVHFIGDEDPALIAQKLLRTNLSDLAAMGATPLCYFLTLMLPKHTDENFISRFTQGLSDDQRTYNLSLAGGDTISTHAPFTCAITAHGLVPQGQALRRSGAKPGDAIYVSGTLGDSALGLKFPENAYLKKRYQLPQPRLSLGESLRGIATSCMDISDGLLQDLTHICRASNVGAEIHLEQLPLSMDARALIEKDKTLWPLIYAGGDDYELLFTAPEGHVFGNNVAKIGTIHIGNDVKLRHHDAEIMPRKLGYNHL